MTKFSQTLFALAAFAAFPFGAASAVEQAGVAAAVQGNIDYMSVLDQKVHKAAGGDEIYLGDEISSAKNSGMQLMLLDETIFTIGAETDGEDGFNNNYKNFNYQALLTKSWRF